MTETPYGFRIVGPPFNDRRLVNHAAAFAAYCSCDKRAEVEREAYLSVFRFGVDFRQRADQWGRLDVAGFAGPCWSPWLWWDIDRPNLEVALTDARRLVALLEHHYGLNADDFLIFFSGGKGFHVGLALSACGSPPPDVMFHRAARRFAEHVAELRGVTIDTGVYDRVHILRAPNSRHPKTGRYKRRISTDELMQLSLDGLLKLASEPAPFDVPNPSRISDQAAADWKAAADQVATDYQAKTVRQANGTPRLNRATLAFIRDGAAPGDRHRLLYSAARNLGEFGCPPALAVALLEESALDSGLSPKDVRRQIECGLSAISSPSPAAGDQASVDQAVAIDRPPGRSSSASPAADLRAVPARLWGSTSTPGPAPAADQAGAKGLPGRCTTHIDPSLWRDEPAPGRPGWIRTTCRECNAFVGYRPGGKGGTP